MKIGKLLISLIILSNVLLASSNVSMSIQNVDTDAGTLDIYMINQPGCSYCTDPAYSDSQELCEIVGDDGSGNAFWIFNSSMDEPACVELSGNYFDGHVGGFQFGLDGIDLEGFSEDVGTALANGFSVFTSTYTVIGFITSMDGSIAPGSDVLLEIQFSSFDSDLVCFSSVPNANIIANLDAEQLPTEWSECYCIPGVDECGVCGGDNSTCLDCAGTPNGSLELDECGVCGGEGADIGCWDGSLVCEETDCSFNPDGCPEGTTYFEYPEFTSLNDLCVPNNFALAQQSLYQAYYFFISVTINDIEIEPNDWVGAFNGDACVGYRKWDTSLCGSGICEVPVMGDDENEYSSGYMLAGEIPSFIIFDVSENIYYDAIPSEDIPWNMNGFENIDVLVGIVFGCTDIEACNYNPNANTYDGSCNYPQENYDCDGNCVVELDCAGVCGGTSVEDACGECGGNNPTLCLADGLGCSVADQCQADYCDMCGECGGNNNYLCLADGTSCTANNDCQSDYCDECGVCGGSGIEEGACDCEGTAPAEGECDCVGNVLDECGICGGDGSSCDDECSGPVCLDIINVDIDAGTLDIHISNQAGCTYWDASYQLFDADMDSSACVEVSGNYFNGHVAGFQFDLSGIALAEATEPEGFTLNTSATTVLGFSLIGATILPGNSILTHVSFTDYEGSDICFSGETGGSGNLTIADIAGGYISANWGPCYDPNCPSGYDCLGVCGGDAIVDACGVCQGPGAIYDCGCTGFPPSNYILIEPGAANMEGNGVISVQLNLTGEIIGEGADVGLGYDTMILTFIDGTVETINRPEDWIYADWRGSNANYEYEIPNWAESNRDFVPWTIFSAYSDFVSFIIDDETYYIAGYFYTSSDWDFVDNIVYFNHYISYSNSETEYFSEAFGGTGVLEINSSGEACDCDGNTLDCLGECGGLALEDGCGICDENPDNDCVEDCLGIFGGDAIIDECGICDGGIEDVGQCANIDIQPNSLSSTLYHNETETKTLIISNNGDIDLEWELQIKNPTNRQASEDHSNHPGMYNLELDKDEEDPRRGPAVTRGSGGPDGFGYTWIDSDEPYGPNFNWQDISQTGTYVTGLVDDNFVGPFPLSFEFPFYDSLYTEFYIQSNGLINFDPQYVSNGNQPIPSTDYSNHLIAWCWDDLYPYGSVYYQDFGNKLIIQFVDYGEWAGVGRINAEIIIYSSGEIIIQYLNSYDGFDLDGNTIGIENFDGTDGLQVAFNTNYIHDELAISFSAAPRWITTNISEGIVSANDNQEVEVTFDALGMYGNIYLADIIFFSNDPDSADQEYLVPVSLTVEGSPTISISTLYDETSTVYFSSSGALTAHSFSALLSEPITAGHLTVTMEGDFNSSQEYAEVYIEGDFLGNINPQSFEATEYFNIYIDNLNTYMSDGVVLVEIQNSGSVDTDNTIANMHRVNLSYTASLDGADFGNTFINNESSMAFNISNFGTDVLRIENIGSNNSDFTYYMALDSLVPGEIIPLEITFTPTVLGPQVGNLTIDSNDLTNQQIMIDLSGEGINPPDITVASDSFSLDLFTGDIDTLHQLMISNNGGSDLIWEISDITPCQSSICLSIINKNTNDETIDIHMINQAGCSYCSDLMYSEQNDCVLYGNNLEGGTWNFDSTIDDQVICQEQYNGNYFDGHVGGFQFELNDPNWSADYTIAGATEPDGFEVETSPTMVLGFSLTGATIPPGSSVLTTVNFTNYFGEQICFSSDVGSNGSAAISDSNGGYVAAQWNDDCTSSLDRLWLYAYPTSGIISSGLVQDVQLTFNAQAVGPGNYHGNIIIKSNDPDESELYVSASLQVDAAPAITIDSNSLDFGQVFAGSVVTDSLTINNQGVDTLYINNIAIDNDNFSVDPISFIIQPGGSSILDVMFAPVEPGFYDGWLTIPSNDPSNLELLVYLTGDVIEPPDIGEIPDAIHFDLSSDQIDSTSLTITNVGVSDLEWSLDIAHQMRQSNYDNIGFYAQESSAQNNYYDEQQDNESDDYGEGMNGRDLGDVIRTYDNFLYDSWAIAKVGNFVYVTENQSEWSIPSDLYSYSLNTLEKQYITTLDYTAHDMTYDGQYLWIAATDGNIYGLDLAGNLIGSFYSTFGTSSHGLTYIGDGMFLIFTPCLNNSNQLARIVDYTGTVVDDIVLIDPDGSISCGNAIAWDFNNDVFWINSYNTEKIFKANLITESSELVVLPDEYISTDINSYYTFNSAIYHDGRNLWWANEAPYLYQFDDGIEDWLSTDLTSGSIPANSSEDIQVIFNAENMFGGDYFADIMIFSNDPDENELIVNASLNVTGIPVIDLNVENGMGDLLAAFDGSGNIRGVSNPYIIPFGANMGTTLQEIAIRSNIVGDSIWFKYYDFSENIIYDIQEIYTFVNGDQLGDILNPYELNISSPGINSNIPNWIDDPGEYLYVSWMNTIILNDGDQISDLDLRIDLGETFIGGVYTEEITISNIGTDVLDINNIENDNDNYSVVSTSFIIEPNDSNILEVIFTPETLGYQEDTLTIYSNDPINPVIILYFSAEVIEAPDIVVMPDSISIALFTGEIDSTLLTITNEGLSELEWNVNINIDYSTQRSSNYNNIGFYADETRTGTNIQFPTQNENNDINIDRNTGDIINEYLEPNPEGATGCVWVDEDLYVASYASVSIKKVNPLTGEIISSFNTVYPPYGLIWDGQYLWAGSYTGNIYGYDLNGTLIGTFSTPFIYYTALAWDGAYFIISPAFTTTPTFMKIDYSGNVIAEFAADNQLNGNSLSQMVWVNGHNNGTLWIINDWDSTVRRVDLSDAGFLAQEISSFQLPVSNNRYAITHDKKDLWVIDWNGPYLQVDDGIEEKYWISTDHISGTIPANSSEDIQVIYNAEDMSGGDYFADIKIMSNDPNDSELIVPASLHVIGAPSINVDSESISYGQVFLGGVYTESITIENLGTDTLYIDSIKVDNYNFSVDLTSFVIDPDDINQHILEVVFTAEEIGYQGGQLIIYSNDPTNPQLIIILSAESVEPSDIVIMPDALSSNLSIGEIETQILTILNEGGSDLVWEIPQYSDSCQASVCLDISNINTDAGTLNIHMTNQPTCSYCTDTMYNDELSCIHFGVNLEDGSNAEWIADKNMSQSECAQLGYVDDFSGEDLGVWFDGHVAGVQFELFGITVTDATGGIAEGTDGITISTSSSTVLAFSVMGATIPPGSGILTQVSFSDYEDDGVCFGEENSCQLASPNVISDSNADCIITDWGDCSLPGEISNVDWISIDPYYGTIPADTTQTIEVTFNATTLTLGSYSSHLLIYSNDPDEESSFVPLTLNVDISYDIHIPLHSAANLVSFYSLPEDSYLDNVFADIGDNILGVITEGNSALNTDDGWFGGIEELNISSGYWLIMLEPDTLDIIGISTDPDQVYNINDNADLISFPVPGSIGISDGLPDDIEGEITLIVGENQATFNYESGWIGSLLNFEGLSGYWFISESDISFSFNLEGLSRTALQSFTEILPEGIHYYQSSQQAFYFVKDIFIPGENVQVGEWVLSYCGDILAGARQWNANNMDIPVMGDDNSEFSEGYCNPGDIPSFKLMRQNGETINLVQKDGIPDWENFGVYMLGDLMAEPPLPESYMLRNAYPNPFNPVTNIRFDLPENALVEINIYDITGRLVETLIKDNLNAGYHSVLWNANEFSSGIYFVNMYSRMGSNENSNMVSSHPKSYNKTQKIMLVK